MQIDLHYIIRITDFQLLRWTISSSLQPLFDMASNEMQDNIDTGNSGHGSPKAQQNNTRLQSSPTDGKKPDKVQEFDQRREWMTTHQPPLFVEPLSDHSTEEKVAAMRAAIEEGADVNELDHEPRQGYNEGRPLHACLRHGFNIGRNLPAIELLLEHGADPRLFGISPAKLPPLAIARWYQENPRYPEDRAVWDRVISLFEQAIVKLGPKIRREFFEI